MFSHSTGKTRIAITLAGVLIASRAIAGDASLPTAYVTPPGMHWFVAQSSVDSVAQLLGSGELIAGPFASEEACDAARPKDTDAHKYKCVTSEAPDFSVRTPLQSPNTAN